MIFWNKNKLTFLRQYVHSGAYSTSNRLRNSSIKDIVNIFRTENFTSGDDAFILSKMNGINYAFFDLDCFDKYELFKKINDGLPYIIFNSSPGHYWGIVDVPYKKIKDIFIDETWKVCNDSKYVNYSIKQKTLMIRGTYENYDRKPNELERSGIFSNNFEMFIKEFKRYYNNEGFVISVSKHKSEELLEELEIRRRVDKIKRIRKHGNR